MHKNRINFTRAATKAESWWGCLAQVKSQVALKSAAANWQMTLHAVGFCFYRKCLSNERISKVPNFRTWQYTYIRKHKGHKRSEKLKTQKNARSISMEGSKAKKGTKNSAVPLLVNFDTQNVHLKNSTDCESRHTRKFPPDWPYY